MKVTIIGISAPEVYVILAVALFVAYRVIHLGDRLVSLGHRVLGLMRDWRDFRDGR